MNYSIIFTEISFSPETSNLFMKFYSKVKSCSNPLRLGTVIVFVSSGVDFVNTPHLYSDPATR